MRARWGVELSVCRDRAVGRGADDPTRTLHVCPPAIRPQLLTCKMEGGGLGPGPHRTATRTAAPPRFTGKALPRRESHLPAAQSTSAPHPGERGRKAGERELGSASVQPANTRCSGRPGCRGSWAGAVRALRPGLSSRGRQR